jgi:cardiolipin synthase A/B
MRMGLLLVAAFVSLASVARAQVITPAPDPNHAILSAPFQAWADGLPGGPLTANNRFELLENGVASLPAKLALIASARSTVFFTTMEAKDDATGGRIARALVDAAARGVAVRALLDGQRVERDFVRRLRDGGVQVALFNPWLDVGGRKHRFHQKLVVADLRAAIIGGLNCSDSYLLGDGRNSHYKDTDARVDGDAAAAASLVFLRQWLELEPNDQGARQLQAGASTWGPVPVTGGPGARAGCGRVIVQENDRGSKAIRDYYERCFRAANRQVMWHVNNLIPTKKLTDALEVAKGNGARVILVTNSARANARKWGAFLGWFQTRFQRVQLWRIRNKGFEVWELDVPVHSKVVTVDGVMASVGSYNFSTSSERNLEMTLVSHDPAFVTEVEAMFDRDLQGGRRIR